MQPISIPAVVLALGLMLGMGNPARVAGQEKDIQPPDVFVHVTLVQTELELIRTALNKPRDTRPALRVRQAQPREVFFQAFTLFLKANRLCYEFTRRGTPSALGPQDVPPATVKDDLKPQHVWQAVDIALGKIRCVKTALKLSEDASPPARDATKTPTEVFKAVVQANRQLNLLLEREFTPADVFSHVQLAQTYTTKVLDTLAPLWQTEALALPAFEPGKRPVDVYKRLIGCYDLIRQMAQTSKLTVLELEADIDPSIVPSDVFDMASLVVSEVRHFAALLGIEVPYSWQRPSRKVPSDVFQQAGLLERQLQSLQQLVRLYPKWHTLKPPE